MEAYATAGGGVMYMQVIRKKRNTSPDELAKSWQHKLPDQQGLNLQAPLALDIKLDDIKLAS